MKNSETVSSMQIHQRTSISDPLQDLPKYPRYIRELSKIRLTQERILFMGAEEPHILVGNGVIEVIPGLLQRLDGTLSTQDIIDQYDKEKRSEVLYTLSHLHSCGLLEDASADHNLNVEAVDPNILAWFKRHADTTRASNSGAAALSRAQAHRLVIFAPEEIHEFLYKQLPPLGFSRVLCLDNMQLDEIPSATLVVIILWTYNYPNLKKIEEKARLNSIPILLSILSGTAGKMIYVNPNETPCISCVEQQLNLKEEYQNLTIPNGIHKQIWVSLSAQEILHLTTRIAPCNTGQWLYSLDLKNWVVTRDRITFLPHCSCRWYGNKQLEHVFNLSLPSIYEQMVAFPSLDLYPPKAYYVNHRVKKLSLIADIKQYYNAETFSLNDWSITGNSVNEANDMNFISEMLLLGAGIQEIISPYYIQRWCASAGNLGSPQLYILTIGFNTVSSGVYYYQSNDHTLCRIAAHPPNEISEFITNCTSFPVGMKQPETVIVVTSRIGKLYKKYGPLGFRHSLLDTGVSISQMLSVAERYGKSIASARWDNLATLDFLRLPSTLNNEHITAVIGIGGDKKNAL